MEIIELTFKEISELILLLTICIILFYIMISLYRIKKIFSQSIKSNDLDKIINLLRSIEKLMRTSQAHNSSGDKSTSEEKNTTLTEIENNIKLEKTVENKSDTSLQYHEEFITDIDKKISIFNKIRNNKFPENLLSFKRVKLEFVQYDKLEDIGRKPDIEEHSNGNGIIVSDADGKIYLFPFFKHKLVDEDFLKFFNGGPEYTKVIKPAICEKVGKKFRVVEKGMLE